jgi:hypothetical protein
VAVLAIIGMIVGVLGGATTAALPALAFRKRNPRGPRWAWVSAGVFCGGAVGGWLGHVIQSSLVRGLV